jgi:CubicO group peptidase (beta-lactamase class C family)
MRHAAIGLTLVVTLVASAARADDSTFPHAEAADVGIDPAALGRLKARAEKARSDAVVVVKDGKLVADWTFGKPAGPIEAMSATKSIVNLAVGRLIDQGKIRSLDQPVSDFYPEWRQGRKRQITIRHLMNHTSGLENHPQAGEIFASPDFVQFALTADLSDDPGSRFAYNNKAVNLLAGVVRKAAGRRMDVYIGEEIFAPMGIADFTWSLDGAGNPHGMAGLQIRAIDLAKIGQMMLDGGTWKGRRLVSEEWVKLSTGQPGQPHDPTCGLLWWLIPGGEAYAIDDAMIADLKEVGLTDASLKKIEALKGKEFDGQGVWAALRPILHQDELASRKLREINDRLARTGRPRPKRIISGPIEGFEAQGYRGQYLVVIPKHRLVAVRQLRAPMIELLKTDDFAEFRRMVQDLVPPDPPRPPASQGAPARPS